CTPEHRHASRAEFSLRGRVVEPAGNQFASGDRGRPALAPRGRPQQRLGRKTRQIRRLAADPARLYQRRRLACAADGGGYVHAGRATAEHDHVEIAHLSSTPSADAGPPSSDRAYTDETGRARTSIITARP